MARFDSPHEALLAAIEAVDTQVRLAALVGVAQGTVSKWVSKGRGPAPEHVLAVEAATGVSRHDLRPDIYPREAPASEAVEGLRA